MSNRDYSDLRNALNGPTGPHLDEETLAELASAEVAGEDIEQKYPLPVAHIETCIQCAESFDDLVKMMSSSFADMAAAAHGVDPYAVYVDILIRDLSQRLHPLPAATQPLLRHIAQLLPSFFPVPPRSPAEVSLEAVEAWMKQSEAAAAGGLPPARTITQSIRQNLAALSLFLEGVADSVWGSTVKVTQSVVENWRLLHLESQLQMRETGIGWQGALGSDWKLVSVQVGGLLPTSVTVWAERVSPTTCKIVVQIDRPGRISPGGQDIELIYAQQKMSARTDASGMAVFEPVPVVFVPEMEIRLKA